MNRSVECYPRDVPMCNCSEVEHQEHTCPYKDDISDDQTPCSCCEACTRDCADGIGRSYGRTRQLLTELVHLGILEKHDQLKAQRYSPREKFRDLIATPVKPLDHVQDLRPDRSRN